MSYFFNLPPYGKLTPKQQVAVDCPNSISVKGGPGTGKSVVTLWRHIQKCDGNNKSVLLTYSIPLKMYLQISAASQKGKNSIASINICTTKSFYPESNSFEYSEIVFDEAQDIPLSDYEIFKNETVSYALDCDQSTNLALSFLNQLVEGLQKSYPTNIEFLLDKNFRNTKEIITLVKFLFPHKLYPPDIKMSGPTPILICTNQNQANELKAIIDIISRFLRADTHNIAILVPTGTDVNHWYKLITESSSNWRVSKYTSKDILQTIENIHITTYKSCKGLEFDTVIIPDFNRSEFKDNRFTNLNEIYVAMTRTKTNLFLIDNSPLINDKCSLSYFQNPINKNIIKTNYEYS